MRKQRLLTIFLALLFVSLACNLPGQQADETATATQSGFLPNLTTPTTTFSSPNRTPLPTIDIVTALPSNSNLIPFVIDPSRSTVTYEVGQTNLAQGNTKTTAAGTTSQVTGAVLVDFGDPRNSQITTITIDISRLTSDSAQRDQAIRDDWLQSGSYPLAIFVPKQINGLPSTDPDQNQISFTVSGDLTMHAVTVPITFNVSAKVVDEFLNGTATGSLEMTDFGFDPPLVPGQWQADNLVNIRFTFEAKAEKG
ncbi:MAG: YceI family protein [Chloroflexi bacterium]|nr:YceI family protein [Chloroflexota bacterium]